MGTYVTDRSTAPVAAAASNSNCEPPESSIDSSGLSTSILKEETRFYLENVNNKKRIIAILTGTPLKFFKKLQTTSWSN
jgi:hypothetical protein